MPKPKGAVGLSATPKVSVEFLNPKGSGIVLYCVGGKHIFC